MAKRKRLTPAQTDYLAAPVRLETKAWLHGTAPPIAPPIAQVAGDVSLSSALAEVSAELTAARAEGRMLQRLPLAALDTQYLVRDRMVSDQDEMNTLIASIQAHGQRTPIEVTELQPGRYGLISGWRRWYALQLLYDRTGDHRFANVLAILRRPDTASAAYIAMVEENEVRAGLSYFERARIAAKAVEQGVFETEKAALQSLFATASRAKRSKIGSFLTIYHRLGQALLFPASLPERLGLELAKRLQDEPDTLPDCLATLANRPPKTGDEELMLLAIWLEKPALTAKTEPVLLDEQAQAAAARTKPAAVVEEIRPGVTLRIEGGFTKPVLILSGENVGPEFRERLEHWLRHG